MRTNQDQPSRIGRPCTVCSHAARSNVEAAVLDGESLSSVAVSYAVTRQALRRHRLGHMTADLRDGGLGAYAIVVRMVETADRLHDLAIEAEERGRIGDAVRGSLAEVKVLDVLVNLGVNGQQELDYSRDAKALESAIAVLLQRVPALGDRIADELDRADRTAYANKIRVYANKCRQLPEHQVSGNERPQELSHADI